MAVQQLNYDYFAYESDDGSTYCKRSDDDWGNNADSGGAACAGAVAWGADSARRSVRKAIYRDPTTFRTRTLPVFTAAAYAALTVGTDTLSVAIPGSETASTYTLVKKVPEKVPSTVVGRQDPDHA